MTALIQRCLLLGFAVLTGILVGWALLEQRPWAAAGALALCVSAHAIVLFIEFTLMRVINHAAGAPPSSWRVCLRAWLHESALAPLVFGWRQPFDSTRWPDTGLSATKAQRGVVLVHGFGCNRGIWNDWLQRLHHAQVPTIAVNLEPPLAPIDSYGDTIEQAVRTLERVTGLQPVVVAHSMGGLAVRAWWVAQGRMDRLHHLLTIGTPHHGTWLARFGAGHNVRQMRYRGAWLQQLSARTTDGQRHRSTCFYSDIDNIVVPAISATLPGADNRCLAGQAHIQMLQHDVPWQELMLRLGHTPGGRRN